MFSVNLSWFGHDAKSKTIIFHPYVGIHRYVPSSKSRLRFDFNCHEVSACLGY
uniref:Uncharacterized protein n=1 Tax=Arundo donax TaxID=35708 RepID=A0A0A9FR24_ARUDO